MAHAPDTNPFSTLGLDPRFDLEASVIERAYLIKLSGAHPDTGGSWQDGPDAATLNLARMTLLDHEQRAVALLDVHNGPNASKCKDLPEGFLMEMMTRREEIEEQITDSNTGGEVSRSNWEAWARDERTQYSTVVGALFDSFNDLPSSEILTKIRVKNNAWRYIERLIEQLDPEYNPADADFR